MNVQENFSQDNCDNLQEMSQKIKDHLNYLIENKDYLKGMVEDEQILKAKIIENKINKIKSLINYQEEKGLNKVIGPFKSILCISNGLTLNVTPVIQKFKDKQFVKNDKEYLIHINEGILNFGLKNTKGNIYWKKCYIKVINVNYH